MIYFFKKIINGPKGKMAGYGVTQDWIQELEYLRAKRLKRFTMVHPILIEKFEVSTFLGNSLSKLQGQAFSPKIFVFT